MTTRATVSINVNCTSATEARIVWVRSEITLTLTAGGIEVSSTGSMVLTRPTVSMTLAPGWRWIEREDRPLLAEPGSNRLVLAGTDGAADIADADPASRCDRR